MMGAYPLEAGPERNLSSRGPERWRPADATLGSILVIPSTLSKSRSKETISLIPSRLILATEVESKSSSLVYSWRMRSIEPLIEQVKDVFGIDPLPVRGFANAESIVLVSVLLHQLMVYYNHLTGRPLGALKHMLGS